ncbi:MAG: AraC family transcriptional regulator [Flavobacteriales bacterium]|nr:helix-turn-helix transcriptional regulator [Flavobacteriales bacterium]MBQ21556.1 AraC family transcriptional regulator [Flavobacteriales bacterium]|tara:strand:+ start:11030 stop:11617 length:588 start_codon:yes stop_codon:yes gene_type:complete
MQDWITEKYLLRNMLSKSCLKLVSLYFDGIEGVELKKARLGEVTLTYDPQKIQTFEIEKGFSELGFTVVTDANESLVENIKVAAIELIHHSNNMSSLIRNSDYISDRVQVPYDKLSKVFSLVTNMTLEKYLILLKIERAKELILNSEYTLSEISYMLGYSSVQYLSNQFKKTTGFTVSQYKNGAPVERIPLENIL